MNRIISPRIVSSGVVAAAAIPPTNDAPQDRLVKYIPVAIAGAYPLLENGIAEYAKTPLAGSGITPRMLEWAVFIALLVYYLVTLNMAFDKKGIQGPTRTRLEGLQIVVGIVAFFIWTYSIKSAIWEGYYNPGLAIVFAGLFVLFAGLYEPTVDLNDARRDGLLQPQPPQPPIPPIPAQPVQP